jgi:hypothetical protein
VADDGYRWARLSSLRAAAAVALAVAIFPLLGSPPVNAATTLGSTLEDSAEATFGGGPTVYQERAPGETLSAPTDGTISSWSVRSKDGGARYELRILHPSAGGTFTAAGTSPVQTIPSDGEDKVRGPFPVSLPVKAGDRVALDVISGAGAPINNTLAPLADELNYIEDPFTDGTAKKPALTMLGNSQELLLQATMDAPHPVNTTLPTIAGEPRDRGTLTGTAGLWANNPTGYEYQWLRCTTTGFGCEPIAGATSTSYAVVQADVGSRIRFRVTATNANGPTVAESAPTELVKPFVLKAVLKISPQPSCTGIPTTLDGSESVTPDPPITYEFDAINTELPGTAFVFNAIGPEFPNYLATLPRETLVSPSSNPRHDVTFTWDRPAVRSYDEPTIGKRGGYARDVELIILKARDKAGAVATAETYLVFKQEYSLQPRTGCPDKLFLKLPVFPRYLFEAPAKTAVSGTVLSTQIRCAASAPCAGSLSVTQASLATARGARAKTKQEPLVKGTFFKLKAHQRAVVRAKLTRAGLAVLRHGRSVKAVLHLSGVDPFGRTATRSFRLTLRRR